MARSRAVGFVAPSGFLPDPEAIDRAATLFAARGWRVQAGDTCFERHQRFAGTDELRAAELQRFCSDRSLDLVLCARGGYGLTRILDRLDFDAIRRARRTICGYSDFTAFNLAYLARAGGVSLHGPSMTDLGAESPDDWTIDNFFAVIEGGAYETRFDADGPDCEARGTLWGGNLAVACALLGTPYFPKPRGGILFFEDVNEPAYKIERMLLQLAQAGVLQRQRALLFGSFDPITPMPNDNGFSFDEVIRGLRARLAVPVVTGLPFGHVRRKLTLPVGERVRLRVHQGRAVLGWDGLYFARGATSKRTAPPSDARVTTVPGASVDTQATVSDGDH
ncbi:MAG: muramoyltetrapeptide carboxypeptidase [Betaproteobacteria bacterium]|nr:MAG: muramoyltetrapeptide carboxypeptidase [Betaproteobacteria bacterium]